MKQPDDPVTFNSRLSFACPDAMATLLRTAAERHLTTPSSYARAALVERLQRDGMIATPLKPMATTKGNGQ